MKNNNLVKRPASNSKLKGETMKKLILLFMIIAGVVFIFKKPEITSVKYDVKYNYEVEYSGQASAGSRLPMLVALHGNGDTTQHFYKTALDAITTPARIVLIEGPSRRYWPSKPIPLKQYGEALDDVITQLQGEYSTKGKPILLGFSGGGTMAFYQALTHGNHYSYIFPISGDLPEISSFKPLNNSNVIVYAYHGQNDKLVSFQGGEKAVDILKAHGIKVFFKPFDGGHHGIFLHMKNTISDNLNEKLELTIE
jgi:predicted esterase